MTENIKASAPSREEIDAMSTQELRDLIRKDAEQPDNSSSDEELIFCNYSVALNLSYKMLWNPHPK